MRAHVFASETFLCGVLFIVVVVALVGKKKYARTMEDRFVPARLYQNRFCYSTVWIESRDHCTLTINQSIMLALFCVYEEN